MMKVVCGMVMLGIINICHGQLRSKDCRHAKPLVDPEYCHKFQYNADTRKCVQLQGKLCADGKNKFLNRQDCQRNCKSSKPGNECGVPMDTYECKTFAYDVDFDQCVNTPWADRKCFKGRSAFTTRGQCGLCIRPKYCDAPVTFDPCLRWFWNDLSGKCGQTVESHCVASTTTNGFELKADCDVKCASGSPICRQPRAAISLKRVFYHAASNKCSLAPLGSTAVGANAFTDSPAGNNMCKKCIR